VAEVKPLTHEELALSQFAELYRSYAQKNKRTPRSFKELATKGQGYPVALELLRSGELVVEWGAPLTPRGDPATAVLAYFKSVPERGGFVMMQDCWTARRMTAEEFATSPKATSP
jgi:hypothetical protein